MNAIALALPTPLPAARPAAAASASPLPAAPAAGLHLLAATCVAQTADLLRLASRRGQLDDAAAAARIALPLAQPHSPHAAMLHALADARQVLMTEPEERRLYLLRDADGAARGLLRLRDNGRVAPQGLAGAERWRLRDGSLELCDAGGQASVRFGLCGERNGQRLYLGETQGDTHGDAAGSRACVLQELRCTHARLSMLDAELLEPFAGLYGAADMVPAPLHAGATLLLGAAHNHADLLAAALNVHAGVHIDGALLHPQGIQIDEPMASPWASNNLHTMRAKDASWYARVALGRSHDAMGRDLAAMPVRGFTMAPSHSPTALDWALAEPGLRIVHVARSNLLATFADTLAAQMPQDDGLLHFEPERFGRFIEMTRRDRDALRQRLRQRNGETVEVDGSRLNAATLSELLGFLHDAPDGSGFAGHAVPMRAQRVITRFDNPDAVLPCLRALDRPGWAEVEGELVDPD